MNNLAIDNIILHIFEKGCKLSNWTEIYNQIINWDNPADSHFFDAASQDNFERECVNIWHQLQEELSPNYQIFYFSEKQQQLLTPEGAETNNKLRMG